MTAYVKNQHTLEKHPRIKNKNSKVSIYKVNLAYSVTSYMFVLNE